MYLSDTGFMIIYFLKETTKKNQTLFRIECNMYILMGKQLWFIKEYQIHYFNTRKQKQTYFRYKYVTIVSVNPVIDIPHPVHVIAESACDIYLVWDTSNSKAKFVKWSHLQVVKPSYSCVFDTVHPSSDHEPVTPGSEVTKYIFKIH